MPGYDGMKAVKQLGRLMYQVFLQPESVKLQGSRSRSKSIMTTGYLLSDAVQTQSVTQTLFWYMSGQKGDHPKTVECVGPTPEDKRNVLAPYIMSRSILGLMAPKTVHTVKQFMAQAVQTRSTHQMARLLSEIGLGAGETSANMGSLTLTLLTPSTPPGRRSDILEFDFRPRSRSGEVGVGVCRWAWHGQLYWR